MDNAIGAKDIDSHDSAIEVDSQALQTEAHAKPLVLTTKRIFFENGGNSMGNKDAASGIEVGRDVVGQNLLDQLF